MGTRLFSSQKSLLRKTYLDWRRNLVREEIDKKSRQIAGHFLGQKCLSQMKRVSLYAPIDHEVGTREIFEELYRKGVRVCFPRVKAHSLEFAPVLKWSDLKLRSFGVLEPPLEIEKEEPASLDMIVVPGLVFDEQAYRIGYGWGYYDVVLSNYEGLKVGLAYQNQILSEVPHDEWDIPMDKVITEGRVIWKDSPLKEDQ